MFLKIKLIIFYKILVLENIAEIVNMYHYMLKKINTLLSHT